MISIINISRALVTGKVSAVRAPIKLENISLTCGSEPLPDGIFDNTFDNTFE